MARAESSEAEVARLRAQLTQMAERIQDALATASGALNAIDAQSVDARQSLTEAVSRLTAEHPYRFGSWDSVSWAKWTPRPEVPSELRIGSFHGLGEIPATIPVFDEQAVVVATRSDTAASAARELLRALAVRAVVELGDRVVLHLLDPLHGGYGFPERPILRQDAAASGHTAVDIEYAVEAGREFTRRHEGVRFHELDDADRLLSPVHVVLALDFPHGYGDDSVDRLNEIARLGPAGIQLILHHDLLAPDQVGDLALRGAHVIEVGCDGVATGPWGSLSARTDRAAPDNVVAEIAARAPARAETIESDGALRQPLWSELVEPEDRWWRESAKMIARARIGTLDDGTPLELRFGQDESSSTWYGPAAVAGTTRTGKSFLVHSAILSLATRYPPDELRFFIFDGQDGVTSQSYIDLPHVDIVSIHTPVDLLRAAIADIQAELTRRNVLATTAGVDTISRYWDVMGSVAGMPRLIVVLEEYQSLLIDDARGVVESALKEIASKGQKFGIHLLLISQRFGATGLVGTQGLFANIDTRVSMRLDEKEIQAAPFGKDGRALIAKLAGTNARLGRVVINDVLGADPSSRTGMVASFGDADGALKVVNANVSSIAAHARRLGISDRPIVLDGTKSPSPNSSRQLAALALIASRSEAGEWPAIVERWAKSSARDGGLDQLDWRGYLHPLPLIVGHTFDVFRAAAIRLDREPDQNVLMISSAPELLAGAAACALVSVALASRRGTLDVTVLGETPPGGSWDGVLSQDARGLLELRGHRLHAPTAQADASKLLDQCLEELGRRLALDAAAQADLGPYLVVGIGADRLTALRPVEIDRYDPQPEARLARLLREGPEVGIHVVLGFAGVNALRRVLPDLNKQRRLFAHKLVGQVSVTDSRALLDDDFGSKVAGAQSLGPQRLGYRNDVNEASKHLLLPYSTDDDIVAALRPFVEAGI